MKTLNGKSPGNEIELLTVVPKCIFFYSFLSVSEMCPLVIFIIISVTLHSCSGSGTERKNDAAYERVVECYSKGPHAHKPGQNPPMEVVICDGLKV